MYLITKTVVKMKKGVLKTALIIVVSLLCFNFSSAQVNHYVKFQNKLGVGKIETCEDNNEYFKIEADNMVQFEEIGKPALYYKYIKLVIPTGMGVGKININKKDVSERMLQKAVMPVQYPEPTSINYKKADFVRPDDKVYNSNNPYPAEQVMVLDDGYMDGNIHIISLAVCPYQYYPKSGKLEYTREIEISIDFISGSKKQVLNKRNTKSVFNFKNILKKIVDNTEDIDKYVTESKSLSKTTVTQTGPLPAFEYVIITPSAFSSAFQNFSVASGLTSLTPESSEG